MVYALMTLEMFFFGSQSSKLIRDVGITHGDETKVGYYVGILVRLCQYMVPAQTKYFFTPAILVFLDPGLHCLVLESGIRSCGPEAYYSFWAFRTFSVDVLFRSIQDLLGGSDQVGKQLF
jgi:hypothetical protein